MRMKLTLLVGTLAAALPASAAAQTFPSTRTDCSGLELFGAKGIPNGATHAYQFRGICRELKMGVGKILDVRWEGWVEIESIYDTKTATLVEGATVKISGPSSGPPSGDIKLVLKCAQDPMLTASKCTIMQSTATTSWPDFAQAWKSGTPFTQGKVTLALASSLSSKSSSGNPPPPPPAPKSNAPTLQDLGKTVAVIEANKAASRDGPAPAVGAPRGSTGAATAEIPLEAGARIALRDGRSVAALMHEGSLRWSMLDADSTVLRTFPIGSRVLRSGSEILVDWGGGTYNAGPERAARRLTLPRRGDP
ncbi:MAG TPA: hypothetical protein VK922_03880 [Gemmatimonadaceae bacterium]|nr:hypothetical protein [Gemmatimonadaceae bacterium]